MADPKKSPPLLFKDDLQKFKVVKDPIHGYIDLHPLIVKIIDTPQFQRLRHICQLGGAYYVFPGATSKRFEHCIGTSHLAGELVQTLYYRQPELKITEKDVLCVMIAGLCHDLGHGPFSHLFEKFMESFPTDQEPKIFWKHETGTLDMFDYMIEKNNLIEKFAEYKLGVEDIAFIKGLIHSPKEEQGNETGRDKDKNFLYEIVANERNKIDVDKWDYFARDAYSVGIANNFDHRRLMKFAQVLDVDGEKQICFRDKECSNIYDMFYTRFLLHRRVYKHKTTCAVEFMIRDALLAANDHILLNDKNGKPCKLSEAVYNMDVYLTLTDHIYHQILCSADDKPSEGDDKLSEADNKLSEADDKLSEADHKLPEADDKLSEADDKKKKRKAREIIERIERRDLYRVIGTAKLGKGGDKEKVLDEIVACYYDLKYDTLPNFSKCDMEIQFVNLDYGMKEENPIDKVRFYRKTKPDKRVNLDQEKVRKPDEAVKLDQEDVRKPDEAVKLDQEEVMHIMPSQFMKSFIRIFSKRTEPGSHDELIECFDDWCAKGGHKKVIP